MLSDSWQKSEFSGQSGNCLEVRQGDDGTVEVRNSRRTHKEPTTFTPAEWSAFLKGAQTGQFNLRW